MDNQLRFASASIFNSAANILLNIFEEGQSEILKSINSFNVDSIDTSKIQTCDLEVLRKLDLLIPYIFLRALSCELYLKLLSKNNKIHDLEKLFALLDESAKSDIKKIVISMIGASYTDGEFYKDLHRHACVFIEWRYIHEFRHEEVSPNFMLFFQKALLQYCRAKVTIPEGMTADAFLRNAY